MERFRLHNFGPTSPANHMDRVPDGDWVRHSDHLAVLEGLAAWCEEQAGDCKTTAEEIGGAFKVPYLHREDALLLAASKIRSELLEGESG